VKILCFGLGALLIALIVQEEIVRVLNPRNHALIIVGVYGVCSMLALAGFAWSSCEAISCAGFWVDILRLALLLGSLSLAYIAVYSAIEDDSPSMAMVKMAWQSGENGCGEADFARVMDDRLFLDQRLEAMQRDGWITESDGSVTLTPLGTFWAKLFRRAQLLLRMDEGG